MDFKIDEPGAFLKAKRKEAKLTLRAVSEHTGLSIGYISRIENNSSTPSLETLYKLSEILSFNIEDICEFESIPLNKDEPIPIEDLFKAFQLKIDNDVISESVKFNMMKLLKVIHNMNWADDLNKINYINEILVYVDQIKRGDTSK